MIWLRYIAVLVTILTGLVSLFWPRKVLGFTGLEVSGARGITEIRSILGALFVALGGVVLYFSAPMAYQVLGITYLGVAVGRGISMGVDRSIVSSNIISLVAELALGVILVM